MKETDPTWHWPPEWRDDYKSQNDDLAREGEDLLTPREYLQCRYDDLAEAIAAQEVIMRDVDSVRAQRHHEVLLKMLEIQGSEARDTGGYDDDLAEARRIADLAYPEAPK